MAIYWQNLSHTSTPGSDAIFNGYLPSGITNSIITPSTNLSYIFDNDVFLFMMQTLDPVNLSFALYDKNGDRVFKDHYNCDKTQYAGIAFGEAATSAQTPMTNLFGVDCVQLGADVFDDWGRLDVTISGHFDKLFTSSSLNITEDHTPVYAAVRGSGRHEFSIQVKTDYSE